MDSSECDGYYAIFDLGATSTISALRMASPPSGNHNPDEITWYSCSSASDFEGMHKPQYLRAECRR